MRKFFAVTATVFILGTTCTIYARGVRGNFECPGPEWRRNEEARGPRTSRARRLRTNRGAGRATFAARRAQRHLWRSGWRMNRLGQRMRMLGERRVDVDMHHHEVASGGQCEPKGMQAPWARKPIPSTRFLIVGLGLDENQMSEVEEIREKGRATIRPLLKKRRSNRKELRAHLKSDNPDPATVGSLIISSRTIRPEIKAAAESMKTAFEDILTEEQLGKWQHDEVRPRRRPPQSRR